MQRTEFARLVLEHQARLRVFIRMLGAVPDAVDDLAQDAFVIAYERRELLEDVDEAGPWLRAIARNLVRNELRKSRRRGIVNAQLTETLLAASEQREPERWDDDWLSALRQCMQQLPDHSRRLVDGRYGRGCKASQLADEVGKTAMAVRQSLARLRTRLRECVEARLAEAGG